MISCQLHDYIEIACMYRFKVRLTLHSGVSLEGVALGTTYNRERQECLLLDTGFGKQFVALDQLKSMQALAENPHFDIVNFE